MMIRALTLTLTFAGLALWAWMLLDMKWQIDRLTASESVQRAHNEQMRKRMNWLEQHYVHAQAVIRAESVKAAMRRKK